MYVVTGVYHIYTYVYIYYYDTVMLNFVKARDIIKSISYLYYF
jgi:hypothetical protein